MSIEYGWEGRTRIYIPTCDMCGEQLIEQYDFDDAVEAKKDAGWRSMKIGDEWIDLCEDCKRIKRGMNHINKGD